MVKAKSGFRFEDFNDRKDKKDWFRKTFANHWPTIKPFLVGSRFLKDHLENMISILYEGSLDKIPNKTIRSDVEKINKWLKESFNMSSSALRTFNR